jgi:hypothetical protein
MRFRLKALGRHLLWSTVTLALVLGTLYVGWYRWPGWYLAGVLPVVAVMAGVHLAVGPLLTFIVARASKPRPELIRDIAIIVLVQLVALTYGTASLWQGRPLYYAYSEGFLQLVQAYDIDAGESALASERNSDLAPHWYSLPRWIWAPLPQDPNERDRIVQSAIIGGSDVISMPRYFKPWDAGLPELRQQLKKVDELRYFSAADKAVLKARMRASGFAPEQSNSMVFTGRGQSLLAIFDPEGARISAILNAH